MAGRGDQADFTHEGILTGFLGCFKVHDTKFTSKLVGSTACVPLFPFVVGKAIWMELVKRKIAIACDHNKADGD